MNYKELNHSMQLKIGEEDGSGDKLVLALLDGQPKYSTRWWISMSQRVSLYFEHGSCNFLI